MLGCCGGGLRVRSWLTFASGLFECLCFGGVVFGWASLVFVIKSDGYFSELCVNTTSGNGTYTIDCSEQDEKLSLIFTIASFMNNFLVLPNGFLFDRFGTMVTRLLGISIYTIGTLMVAFSNAAIPILLYPALSFIAVGGILFLVTNMPVGNLFGSRRSTIITFYNGAFDSSSVIFLIIKLLHEIGVSIQASFIFLSVCSLIHLLRTFLLMPRKHFPYPVPEGYTYGMSCGQKRSNSIEGKSANQGNIQTPAVTKETALQEDTPSSQNESEKSFRSCVLSWFFLWHLLWLSVIQLRHFMFIGILNPMLAQLTAGDPALVSTYTNAFAITQLCGVLCAPWNGLLMDRHKGRAREPGESEREADLKAAILSLAVTALQGVLFSVCAAIPLLPLQYLTFVLQVLNRSFLYGGNAAFISVAFPAAHFGKLFGLVMALSAVVSLLQYPLFALIKGPLGGDPLYVNIALTLLTLLAFIHPIYLYFHCRRLATQRSRTTNEPYQLADRRDQLVT